MQTPEEFVKSNDPDKILTFDEIDDRIKLIRARDAEWQARVDKLETTIKLQENMLRIYNEEFTKQGHRLLLAQARVEKLEAALGREA